MAREFRAVLHGVDDSSATYVLVPASIMKTFAGRIRVPVRMTINGVEHRTTICDMGLGPALGVPGAVRKAAGIDRGDRITRLDRGRPGGAHRRRSRRSSQSDGRPRAQDLRRPRLLASQRVRALGRGCRRSPRLARGASHTCA